MKKRRAHSGKPLDTSTYLTKINGLEIQEAESDKPNDEETIVLDKWVRRDFPEMGFTSYERMDP
jgi:hypothetical protein